MELINIIFIGLLAIILILCVSIMVSVGAIKDVMVQIAPVLDIEVREARQRADELRIKEAEEEAEKKVLEAEARKIQTGFN